MNIVSAFLDFLEDEGYGTIGIDLFIGSVPFNASDRALWIVSSGGNSIVKNIDGTKQKTYSLNVYMRSMLASEVYDTLESLETFINSSECFDLSGYNVLEFETILFPSDQDLDVEDRTVGLLTIEITVYQD